MQINDVKKFDQQISLIFHLVIAGPLILYSIGYLNTLNEEAVPTISEPPIPIKLFVSVFSGLLILLAFYIYKKEIKVARTLDTLEEKLSRLFKGSIIHYGILEFASFIPALAFFLTHDHLFTAVYIFILFLMSLNRPTPRKYIQDLYLEGEERDKVLNKRSLS